MADPATTAERQQVRQQSLVGRLVSLPFRFIGVLFGSLFLSIVVECVCMHVFWPSQGWHHAEAMLHHELDQIADGFAESLIIHEPGRTVHRWVTWGYEVMFIRSGVLDWVRNAASQSRANSANTNLFRRILDIVYVHLEGYLLAALYTTLTFLARLLVLVMMLPLFALAAAVGLVDGLVRRDLRRFGSGRESGYLHHRAKATIMPLAVLPWVTYLALPVAVSPLWILVPAAGLLAVAIDVAVASFKKYL